MENVTFTEKVRMHKYAESAFDALQEIAGLEADTSQFPGTMKQKAEEVLEPAKKIAREALMKLVD